MNIFIKPFFKIGHIKTTKLIKNKLPLIGLGALEITVKDWNSKIPAINLAVELPKEMDSPKYIIINIADDINKAIV